MLGIVCRRLGLLDEALLNSKRALQLDKGLVAAKMNIANTELQKSNLETAINLLERIVSEEPEYHEAKANLALAYKSFGQIERALSVYKKLKFVGLWSEKARFNYSTTLVTIGNFKEGWRYYEYRWFPTGQSNMAHSG